MFTTINFNSMYLSIDNRLPNKVVLDPAFSRLLCACLAKNKKQPFVFTYTELNKATGISKKHIKRDIINPLLQYENDYGPLIRVITKSRNKVVEVNPWYIHAGSSNTLATLRFQWVANLELSLREVDKIIWPCVKHEVEDWSNLTSEQVHKRNITYWPRLSYFLYKRDQ